MVSRAACYPTHLDPAARYMSSSRSCGPYLNYPERRFQLASHDARAITMTDPQIDDSTQPRKRIAVACGRCRKRKIRCSGDPGHGQPCTNCKNANIDQCLFLRVQSQEAPLRDDRYAYNMDVGRSLAQRESVNQMSPLVAAQYQPDMHLLNSGAMPHSYHRSSSQAYPNMSSKYYSMADWNEPYGPDVAAAATVYGLSCTPSYPVMSGDPENMVSAAGYGPWTTTSSSSRPKAAHSQQGHVYVDAESAGYPYSSATTANLVHRPAAVPSGDSSAYSFSSVAASLPQTTERVLPNPAMSRTLGSSAGTYRHADGLPAAAQIAGYSASSKSSHSSAGTGHTSPTSPISDAAAAAVATGYTTSPYEYAGRSSHGQNSEVYGSATSQETIFADSDRHAASQGSAVDLTGYTYGGSTGSPDTASSTTTGGSMRRVSSAGSALTSRTADSQGYAASDGSHDSHHSGGYHHSSHHRQSHHHQSNSSSRHGHGHNGHSHSSTRHHSSSNHHHHQQQQQQQQQLHHHPGHHTLSSAVNGVTASAGYAGEAHGSNNSGTSGSGGLGGVLGTTAAADSHRTLSVSSRR